MGRIDAESETLIPIGGSFDVAGTIGTHHGIEAQQAWTGRLIAHALRADGFDASEDGTGRGTPLVPIAFDTTQMTSKANRSHPKPGDPCHPLASVAHPPAIAFSVKDHGADAGELAPTLRAGGHDKSHANAGVMPAIAFANTAGDTALGLSKPGAPPITTRNGDPGNVLQGMSVRRLTPLECERLQGFPDNYTLIPYGRGMAKDGPRYKALGNSMAVPVMAWIGRRIQMVEDLRLEAAS